MLLVLRSGAVMIATTVRRGFAADLLQVQQRAI
jgi:hypothetical protein